MDLYTTDRQTDRQTDIETYIHAHMYVKGLIHSTYTWCMASPKSTRFMAALTSLYDSSASSKILLSDSQEATERYLGSPIPMAK